MRKAPPARDQRFVNEFLMDCLANPYECGEEDDDTGVFSGTAGSNIAIVYVPGPDLLIGVTDIRYV